MNDVVTSRVLLPISLSDMKRHLVSDQLFTDDDLYITGLIHAAANDWEQRTKRTLLTSTHERFVEPTQQIYLYTHPIQSIVSVKCHTPEGVEELEDFETMLYTFPAWVRLDSIPAGTRVIQVRYVAGHLAASDIQPNHCHAVKFLVAHWYLNREPVHPMGSMARSLPLAYESLVTQAKLEVYV